MAAKLWKPERGHWGKFGGISDLFFKWDTENLADFFYLGT